VTSSRTTPSTNCVHDVCVCHCWGFRGRPHRRARRSRTSCILSHPVGRLPRREAHNAPTACILILCGIAAKLMQSFVIEHVADNPQASCLLQSGGGLTKRHATHQLRASCLCVALSGPCGRHHRRARRSRTSCILSNPVWRWPL
jgi:hypothetical protein